MRTPPKLAIPPSADAVTAEVRKLLRAAAVGGQIPTPKADILRCVQLVEAGELALAEYELTRAERISGFIHRAMGKVRGFLDRRTKEIYVDPRMHDSQKTFVTYHEVFHRVAPWQQIYYTEDDNSTLSLGCETLFEREANYGAAEILFQCERFEAEARDFDLSVPSALHLADKYDASYHSSLRRFSERNHRPCLLLILKPTSRANRGGGTSFFVSHSIPSAAFTMQFGDPFSQPFINPDHQLGEILNNAGSGEIGLSDLKGFRRTCTVEYFNNQYNHFVMIHPKDVAPARRRVSLRAS
jgi:hypothetical protein